MGAPLLAIAVVLPSVGLMPSTITVMTAERHPAQLVYSSVEFFPPQLPDASHHADAATLVCNSAALHARDTSMTTARACIRRRCGHAMLTIDSGPLGEGATGMTEGRVMRWTADAMSSERCDGPISAYLARLRTAPNLIELVDASVLESVPIDSPDDGMGSDSMPQRYRVLIAPLRFPGLSVAPSAIMRVDPLSTGLRITTEQCENEYSGMHGRIFGAVQPEITSRTELRATPDGDGCELVAESHFRLTLPLPGWWPIPNRAMDAGRVLIQRIVEKDTRLAATRIKAEFEASRLSSAQSSDA